MQDKTESSATKTSEPFFARFLESQEKAKGPAQTLKFPSDSDEWVLWNSITDDDK
jgi:hypothetical protein